MDELALFYPDGHEAHAEWGHPERPERVESIVRALKNTGLWKIAVEVAPERIPIEILEKVHSPAYLSLLERISKRGGHLDADTYVTTASWELALQAAGGTAALARAVWDREARTGIALSRPPGHHATRGQGMGFCLLNNIALAAETLLQDSGAERLAIVDLDLHHGNGTQDIFYKRQEVMFISTHQQPLYPGTGSLGERGQGKGLGTSVNFPMPPGSGDQAFEAVMEQAIIPLLARFIPDMVLVSYGFDTHWSDPLGHLLLSADKYANLITRLREFAAAECKGRIALVLEGGYDLEAAAVCTVGVVKALLGMKWEDPLGPAHHQETEAWREMLNRARELWAL